jgi:hypothetical protein
MAKEISDERFRDHPDLFSARVGTRVSSSNLHKDRDILQYVLRALGVGLSH